MHHIHEFAHAYSADRAGDGTPLAGQDFTEPDRSPGPDRHDNDGGVLALGFWDRLGRPVPINPYNFRHPRWDNLRVSLWGPLSNILTAAVTGTALRFWGGSMNDNVAMFVGTVTAISIGLAVFNLIPIAPLDGSHILSSLLPYEQAKHYDRVMGQYGYLSSWR